MSEIVWFILVILGGVGAVIWAESIPTDREIMWEKMPIWLKDVRYQVRIRKG